MAWRELLAYWSDHFVDGRPPARAEIDPPLEITRLLPNLMLLRPVEDGFLVRLAGSELVRRAGRDNTGMIIRADAPNVRGIPTFHEFLARLVATRQPVLYAVSPGEHAATGAVGLILPLSDRADGVDMILGALFYEPSPPLEVGLSWSPGALRLLEIEDEMKRIQAVRHGR